MEGDFGSYLFLVKTFKRLCTLCEFNEIEDESYFLFQCSLYDELRSEWVSHIVNKTANFLELDKINKFKVTFDIHHRITAKRKKQSKFHNMLMTVFFF